MLNLLAALVLGQAGSSAPPAAKPSAAPPSAAASEKARQAVIWNAVYNRMNTQIDIWWELGDFPKIINLLRFQAELYPKDYEVATNLGWMYENIRDDKNAEAAYARYQGRNPEDPDAVLPAVQKAYMQKNYKRVITLATPAIERKGVHPNVFRLLAHSYKKTGDYKNSLRIWDLYLAGHPDDLPGQKNRESVKKLLEG